MKKHIIALAIVLLSTNSALISYAQDIDVNEKENSDIVEKTEEK